MIAIDSRCFRRKWQLFTLSVYGPCLHSTCLESFLPLNIQLQSWRKESGLHERANVQLECS